MGGLCTFLRRGTEDKRVFAAEAQLLFDQRSTRLPGSGTHPLGSAFMCPDHPALAEPQSCDSVKRPALSSKCLFRMIFTRRRARWEIHLWCICPQTCPSAALGGLMHLRWGLGSAWGGSRRGCELLSWSSRAAAASGWPEVGASGTAKVKTASEGRAEPRLRGKLLSVSFAPSAGSPSSSSFHGPQDRNRICPQTFPS